VKVPHHLELATAALTAGKAVYCEWPLGNGVREAEQLAALAKQQGVLAVAGLQARAAPSVLYVRGLVRQGYVGEVLSTTLICSGAAPRSRFIIAAGVRAARTCSGRSTAPRATYRLRLTAARRRSSR